MKSLHEHNKQARIDYYKKRAIRQKPAGLLCNTCNKELVFDDPSITLQTDPPSKKVLCPNINCPVLSNYMVISTE